MTNAVDSVLDAYSACTRKCASYEAALSLCTDLLLEWMDDELDPPARTRLRAATRSFLLNAPVLPSRNPL